MTAGQAPGTAGLSAMLATLSDALAVWAARDDARAQPDVRRAANDAADAIDAMLADLHRMRAGLIDAMRASDDAAAVRVDALLARSRAGRLGGQQLDSERWTCTGCGGLFIGGRPAGDRCRECPAPTRPGGTL